MSARWANQLSHVGIRLLAVSFIAWGAAQTPYAEEVAAQDAAPAAPATEAAPSAEPAPSEAPAPDAAATEEAPPAESSGKSVVATGSYEATADLEWNDSDSDIDLDQFLRMKLTFPNHPRIRINTGLWLSADFDSDEDQNSALRDIDDAYGSDLQARPLQLNIEIDDVIGDSLLRIGRQRVSDGVAYNRIDGVYFKQFHQAFDWYVFAGARASLYEDTHNDFVGGGGVSWQASQRTRFALDAYYGEDDHDDGETTHRGIFADWLGFWYPRNVDEELNTDMFSLSVWHSINENTRLYGQFNFVDGSGDELTLNVSGLIPAWELTYDLAYRRRLSRADDRVDDISTFYRIQGSYEEYDDFLLSLHKPLSKRVTLSFETEVHNSHEENPYTGNWDFERYAAIVDVAEIMKTTDLTMALEYWDASDETGFVVTGEATKKWSKLHLTLGADYEAYDDEYIQYHPLPMYGRRLLTSLVPGLFPGYQPLVSILDESSVSKRENVHSFYTKFKWLLKEDQNVTTRVDVEQDDGRDSPYWRVRVGYAIYF